MRASLTAAASLVLVAGLLLAVACGGGGSSNVTALATQAANATPSATLDVTARSLKFDKKALVAPAGQNITLHFDNKDNGTQHNVAIYTDSGAKTNVFRGDIFKGESTKDYTFPAPAAGVYYFRCDVHPDMNGAFIVR